MKKLFGLLTISGLFLAISAQAQSPVYNAHTLYSMGTGQVAGSAATNINAVLDCRKQKDVALQIMIQPKTTATDALSFVFARSVDGVTYGANDFVVTLAPGGTAGGATTTITNIPSATTMGVGYLKLMYLTNAAAAAGVVTNASVIYGVKISAP